MGMTPDRPRGQDMGQGGASKDGPDLQTLEAPLLTSLSLVHSHPRQQGPSHLPAESPSVKGRRPALLRAF